VIRYGDIATSIPATFSFAGSAPSLVFVYSVAQKQQENIITETITKLFLII